MKALFVGVGSIGRRHIRDFYNECRSQGTEVEIHVLRRVVGDIGSLDDIVNKQITVIQDADYDVAFITNPTHLHYDALKLCSGKAKWYFIEKPIFETMDRRITDLDIDDSNTYVAAPMRHTLIFHKFRSIIESNKVYSARITCSSYLPDWRKGVDYRSVYSSHEEMGGGVSLDLIHDIDYACELFSSPIKIHCVTGKFSDLEISSNDLGSYILEYENMLCEIHLDYFGRKSVRTCEVYTTDGTYVADFIQERIILPDGSEIDCHVMQNEEFINEMSYFYRFISGKEASINPPSLALKVLNIALGGICPCTKKC